MNTKTATVGRILQLLLRCGMVCQEELNVVLEMMQAVPESPPRATGQDAAVDAEGCGSGNTGGSPLDSGPNRRGAPALGID